MMARQTTWTPELWEQILSVLRAGNSRTMARRYVFVPEATFYQWLKNRPELKEDLEQAEAHAVIRVQTRLQAMMNAGDSASMRWFIERRDRETFGDQSTINHHVTVEDGDPAATARAKLERMAQAQLEAGNTESGDADTG
jgi:hypothetical protein